jgi:hypothetical protein
MVVSLWPRRRSGRVAGNDVAAAGLDGKQALAQDRQPEASHAAGRSDLCTAARMRAGHTIAAL